MATESVTSHKAVDEEALTVSLKEIIEKNLTIGISKLDSADDHDFNDEIDTKSNASSHHRRASISYSQPSSPKAHPGASLSPLSSVSSLSELSTEYPDGNDSESCGSLNSVNSTHSLESFNTIHCELITKQIILENKASTNLHPLTPNFTSISSKGKDKIPPNNLVKSTSHESTFKTCIKPKRKRKKAKKKPSKTRRNSKDCLDITNLSRLTTKSIALWTVSEVVEWVKLIDKGKYKEYAIKFQTKKVDGKKLYKINYAMLQSLEVYHPSARKAILAALHKLKEQIRHNSKEKINLYAKSHGYDEKKYKKKAHRRGISTPHTLNLKESQNEMYVVAVKRRNSNTQQAKKQTLSAPIMPALEMSKSAGDMEKDGISEFLDEWEIPYTNEWNINFINSTILQQTNNFTMIQLANKKIVYAVTAKVEKWTNDDVCKWLNSIANGRFRRFTSKFKERKTTGFDLLNISRVQLQNNIRMLDPQMRSTLLREIKLLKIATKPSAAIKSKKRISAVRFKDIQAAKSLGASGRHRKAKSVTTGMMGDMYDKYSKSHNSLDQVVPRKLGPRDIGRMHGFKGTKWDRSLFNYDFLEEKINYHAKSSYFEKRKQANPVQHKQTVNEIGRSTDFQPIDDCNNIIRQMRGGALFADKPISRKNPYLDSLKGQSVPKSERVTDIIRPVGWEPINFEYQADGKEFLAEHFWFDGSGVPFNFAFSRLLNCLPPQKQLELNKQPAPTGWESKLNWLKMLMDMVSEEMEVIRKEDALYESEDMNDEQKEDEIVIDDMMDEEQRKCPMLTKAPSIEIIKEEPEIEVEVFRLSDDDDGAQNGEEAEVEQAETDDVKTSTEFDGVDNTPKFKMIVTESGALGTESDGYNVSPPSGRKGMHKRARSARFPSFRANTALANSTLGGIARKSMTPRRMKRTMSRADMNRRRFMSQESVDSIQAIIQNIEKQRSSRNVENVMD